MKKNVKGEFPKAEIRSYRGRDPDPVFSWWPDPDPGKPHPELQPWKIVGKYFYFQFWKSAKQKREKRGEKEGKKRGKTWSSIYFDDGASNSVGQVLEHGS